MTTDATTTSVRRPDRWDGLRSEAAAKVGLVCWTGLYVLVLLWSVSTLIAPAFGYQGYFTRSPSAVEVFVTIQATLVVAVVLPTRCRRPSDVARLFLTLTVAVPVLWMPLLYGPLSAAQVSKLALFTAGAFCLLWLVLTGRPRRLVPIRVSSTSFWLLLAEFFVLAVGYLISLGLAPKIVGFSDVYAQRALYKASIDSVGAYLVGWLAGGTLPVVLAVGLYRRSKGLVLTGLVGVLFLYSLTGQKSYLIGVAILIGTFVMTRRGISRSWSWMALLSLVIVLLGVLDRVRGGFGFTSLLVRRAISTAGINTGFYVDKFDGGPYYELRHSVLSMLGAPPYGVPPAQLVGDAYYTHNTMANANFMADGFANFGWWGILGAALVVGVLLRVYDRVAANLPLGISAPALVFVLLSVANTAILTVIATHGAAVLVGWIALLPASVAVIRRSGARTHEARVRDRT